MRMYRYGGQKLWLHHRTDHANGLLARPVPPRGQFVLAAFGQKTASIADASPRTSSSNFSLAPRSASVDLCLGLSRPLSPPGPLPPLRPKGNYCRGYDFKIQCHENDCPKHMLRALHCLTSHRSMQRLRSRPAIDAGSEC